MQRLIATKALTYATRRLMPGDVFEAKPMDARLLIAVKKAKAEREPGKIAPPPAGLTDKASGSEDLKALRAEYTEKVGKRPFGGWDAAELQRRIAEAE